MASVLGFFMFGEVLTQLQLVGGALIILGGVSQIFFSTKAASKAGDKIEKEAEIRETLEAHIDEESAKESLS